jgi:hypothetical protein
VYRGPAASTVARRRSAAVALAMLAGAWCVPCIASTGFSIDCDQDDATGPETEITAVPSLAAHTDSALQKLLDDDAVKVPALAESTSDSPIDDVEDAEPADNASVRGTSESPAINTRLPGVSESSLPSFRRQMYRTDI